MMEPAGKNRKLQRRDFLQTVAAGGALVPALGAATFAMPISASQTSDAPSIAPSKGPDEPDIVSLENGTLRVSFDAHSGALVGLESKLTGWRIQNRRELGRSFVMFAPMPDRHFNPILGEKNPLAGMEKSSDGKSITFIWKDLESEHAGRLDITLKGTATLDENGLTFDAAIANHSALVVNSVSYPILGDLAAPEGEKSLTRINMEYAAMRRTPLFPDFSNERGYFGVDYPIQMVPTPGRPFVLVSAGQHGLYAGDHDTTSMELIQWTFELKPGYVDSLDNKDPAGESISGHPVSIVFSVTHFPITAAGESMVLSRVVLQPYKGTWHHGIDIYKQWRGTWFKRPPAPAWSQQVHSWQQLNIDSSEDDLRLRYEDLPKIGRDCAKYGVKAIQLVGWNNGGQDRGNPSHDTDPRLGTKEQLRDAIAQIQGMGVNIILFNKYTWSDITTEWFRKELIRYAALDPYGDYYQYQGYRYQTPTQLAEINPRRFAVMCMNSPRWREVCAHEFQKSIDLGAAGILYDEVQHHGTANYCFSADHGHHMPADIYAGDALLGAELRKIAAESGREFLFSGEAPYDLELRHYSLSYFRIGADHVPLHRYIDPYQPMMVAATGFNDREMINACLRFRYVICYEPYNFKGHLDDFPLTMEYGRKVDALRSRYKDYLWDAEFWDTLGAEVLVDGKPCTSYSVFGHPETAKRAVVIVNQSEPKPITATVRLTERAGKLVSVTPERPDPQSSSGTLIIPPRSAAVLLEGVSVRR
jgi:hypothetical protein